MKPVSRGVVKRAAPPRPKRAARRVKVSLSRSYALPDEEMNRNVEAGTAAPHPEE